MVGPQDARISRLDFGGDPDTDDPGRVNAQGASSGNQENHLLVGGTGPFGSFGERDN